MRIFLAACTAALVAAGGAQAIVNGEPDGNRHPYVVALGFLDASGRPSQFCTGTLVSPTLVVTAGHCTYGASGAVVWADSRAFGPPRSFGLPATHPDFTPQITTPNTGDLGVVRLLAPIPLQGGYAALPAASYLDDLGTRRGHELGVTLVGYGAQSLDPFVPPGERRFGTARIKNLQSSFVRDYGLKVSGANGSGRTGSCLGDSGGPVLHGDSNVIVGVQSFGDDSCTGASYAYRLDTPSARSFLDDFIALP